MPAQLLACSPLDAVLAAGTSSTGQPDAVVITDLSTQPRFGCKGPRSAEWLASQGLPLPAAANTALELPEGGRILRLGLSEFLVEDSAARVQQLADSPRQPGVYPVLRQDLCLQLRGKKLPQLLRQTCSFNFAALDAAVQPVILTSMTGVAVTVMPDRHANLPSCLIWCDGSYGVYLWQTLCDISAELHPPGSW